MSSDFKKIRHNNRIVYIRNQFLDHALGQVILAGEETWHRQNDFKTIPSSERTRVLTFTVSVDGIDRVVYIKQYLFKSLLQSLKRLFLSGSPAKQAFKAETMLAADGFDVAGVIALVESRDSFLQKNSYLATFGIENVRSVRNYILGIKELTTSPQLADWRGFIRDLGLTIGRMHAKGIVHGDLRTGNILIRRDGNLWRFFFIDNERTKKFRRLPFICRVKNLVQLNMGPYGIMSGTDRMRFFDAYCSECKIGKKWRKILIKIVLRKTARRLDPKKRMQSLAKGALRTNYRYFRVETDDITAVFLRSFWNNAEPVDFLRKLDNLRTNGQILKDDRNCLVCRLKWNDRDLTVKQYKHKGIFFSLLDTIGKSRAKRDWLNGSRLIKPGRPVPDTLVFVERHKAGLVWESYIASEDVKSNESVNFAGDKNKL